MAKAIYVGRSVGLYVCLYVSLLTFFWRFSFHNFHLTATTPFIFCPLTYFGEPLLILKKFQGQGQRSRSRQPYRSNYVNHFFSKTKNIVFFKLWQLFVLGEVHNRLDFGGNRSRHSGSRSRKAVTFKLTFNTTSTDQVM